MNAARFFIVMLGVVCGVVAHADVKVIKKDGTAADAKNLRRQGDNIIATMDLPPAKPGDPVKTGDIGIPIAQIEKIEFPEPGALKTAPDLIVQGKAEEALAQVDQAAKYYEGFRDAPGSWWRQLTLLKMNTLVMLGREKEADALADTMSNLASDPEAKQTAKVLQAAAATRRGDAQKGAEALDSVLKESKKPDTLAAAAIYRGQSHLALKDWENALLSFLQIPVLYPEAKELAPASMLGVGRAHFGLEDFPAAKKTFKEVISSFKGTPEATAAKAELELIAKREKALSEPGAKKEEPPAKESK